MMKREEIYLDSEGNKIMGNIFIPDKIYSGKAQTLCICHGIPSGAPPDPNDPGYPQLAQDFCKMGLVTMIFNFRGTGLSNGNFDIMGWTKDLFVVLDFLYGREEVDKEAIFLMGFSAGAAVSIYCAAHDSRVSYVVSCACPAEFPFAQDLEQTQIFLQHCRTISIIRDKDFPPSLEFWAEGFKTISPKEWINKISPRPILIIQGEADELVNASHAWTLYNNAAQPKELALIPGAGHRLRLEKEAMDKAKTWIRARSRGAEEKGIRGDREN